MGAAEFGGDNGICSEGQMVENKEELVMAAAYEK